MSAKIVSDPPAAWGTDPKRALRLTRSKYKFMELNTAQRRRGLEEKIPDIRKTLQMVEFLKERKVCTARGGLGRATFPDGRARVRASTGLWK